MPAEPHLDLSHISLKIDGAASSPDIQGDLLEVTVDHTLHLPSMFTVRLHCDDMKWLEDATFREGKKIEIFFGPSAQVKLLSGCIASLEPDLDVAGPTLLIRGYDLSHKLYRGRYRRSFSQVTDADLVKKLATEAGLTPGKVEATSEVREYVFQNNQTNAEFLQERARWNGFELYVVDDKLHFCKPQPTGQVLELAWGDDLTRFRPRLSTAEQINEVEVRGWDPVKKKEVVGRATQGNGAPRIGEGQSGAAIAKKAWGEAKTAIVDCYVRSPKEAERVAQAALDEAASSFVEAEATCHPEPRLRPGQQVKIKNVGQRFSGTYYVTQVTHEWTAETGMTTHFTVSGRRDRGVWSLLEETTAPRTTTDLVIGLVTNNKDPQEMGRVKVKYPTLSDKDESAWARIVSPMAGSGRGFLFLPEINDEVIVGFEQGDIHRPYVLGALWNGVDKPPMPAGDAVGGDGKVNKRLLKSRSGHSVTLDDTERQEQVVVKSRSGHTVTLDDTSGSEQISIVDKTGKNKIVIQSPQNSMDINVEGNLTIEAQGKITLKGVQGVDMSSSQSFKISGQTEVDVTSNTQLKLSGTAGAELSSPANTAVKGSMVDVNGSGTVSVSGATIKLN